MIPFFPFFFLLAKPCGLWDPQPGMEPSPPAVDAGSLNHRTTRAVPSTIPFFYEVLRVGKSIKAEMKTVVTRG